MTEENSIENREPAACEGRVDPLVGRMTNPCTDERHRVMHPAVGYMSVEERAQIEDRCMSIGRNRYDWTPELLADIRRENGHPQPDVIEAS